MQKCLRTIRTVALAFLLACGGGGGDGPTAPAPVIPAGPPARMSIVSGDAQTGPVGAELTTALVVKVTDAAGRAVSNQIVNFRVIAGGGSVFAGTANTNSDGLAQERWTLGTVAADSQRVEARAVDPATGAPIVFATFRAVAVPAAAARLQKSSTDSIQTGVGYEVLPKPRVRVLDNYSNPIAGATVVFAVTAGGGAVTGATQVSNDSGYASVGSWNVGGAAGANTLRVVLQSDTTSSLAFTATARAHTLQVANGGGQSGSIDDFLERDPGFQVLDFTGKGVPGIQVTFTQSEGSVSAASATSDTGGFALVRWRLGPIPREQTIVASISGGASASIAAKGRAQFDWAALPSTHGYIAEFVAPAPKIRLRRLDGAGVAGATISFSPSGSGQVSTATATTASSGEATVQWRLGTTTGDNVLTATVGDSTIKTTSNAHVPIAQVNVGLSTAASSARHTAFDSVRMVVGQVKYEPVVQALDAAGNDMSIQSSTAHTIQWTWSNPAVATFDAVRRTLTAVGEGVGELVATILPDQKTGKINVRVVAFPSFTTISAGRGVTCGLIPGGKAYCWGTNFAGQLGVGSPNYNHSTPVPVTGGLVFSDIAAGEHTCGITLTSAAYCWGQNTNGQLGIGTAHNLGTLVGTPRAVQGSYAFEAIGVGNRHTCGLSSVGKAHCWGLNNNGQLGTGTVVDHLSPVAVSGNLNFSALTSGGASSHTCALTSSGTAYCWGWNSQGQLGDGTQVSRSVPVVVQGGLVFASISAGGSHTCGITTSGNAYCWGDNSYGGLGDGTTTRRLTPTQIQGGLVFAGLTAGSSFTCGRTSAGSAYCWGYNGESSGLRGRLGDGTTVTHRTLPTPVVGGHAFVALTAGGSHACGLKASGAAYCWGGNAAGAIGNATTTDQLSPVLVFHP